MHIKRIIEQHRRDFRADYECEHCGYVELSKEGYDDANFHNNVIPKMKCKRCGKIASDRYCPRTPKYAANEDV